MDVSYRVTGADDVARAFARLRGATKEPLEGLEEFGEGAAERSRGIVRILTGALRGTIRAERTGAGFIVAAGSGDSPQAGVLNYGSDARNIPGDEFLTGPASDEPKAAEHVEDNLRRTLRRLDLT